MMSRTVRYFKLMYIVAGILMSNEKICETVDQIQITPRVEVYHLHQLQKRKKGTPITSTQSIGNKCNGKGYENSTGTGMTMDTANGQCTATSVGRSLAAAAYARLNRPTTNWFKKFDLYYALNRIKHRISPIFYGFNIWTIPNYLLDYSTNFISRKFVISSDCDMIYNR